MDRLPALALTAALAAPGLVHGATVRGEVVSYPDGAPLAGVQVLVRDPQGRSAAAWTEADGTFEVLEVEPGLVRVQAVPRDGVNRIGAYYGDVSAFCAAPTTRLAVDDVLDGVRIELPEGGVIAGTVEGVSDGSIVTAEGADTLNLSVRRTSAVEQGTFSVQGLSSWVDADGAVLPGAYRVSAVGPTGGRFWYPGTWDREAAELVPAVRGETTDVSFARPPGSVLAACFVGPDGAPWPGAAYTVRASEGSFAGTTDGDGCLLHVDLPGLTFALTVDSDGLARTTFDALPPGDAGDLVVDPEAALLLDGVEQIGLATPGAGTAALRFDVVDGRVGRLPAGDWDVLAPPAPTLTQRPDRVPVTLVAGDEVSIEVVPPPAGTVEVAVLRRTDSFGLRGARVEAVEPDTGVVLGLGTTAEGRVRLTGLPLTPLLLRASWEPFCPADPQLVPTWSGPARAEPLAAALTPLPDESVGGPLLTLPLPPDRDHDAMDDVWELLHGLPIDWHDAAADPDGDGVDNLGEYQAHTDPLDGSASSGCSQSGATPTCPARPHALILALCGGLIVRGRRRG